MANRIIRPDILTSDKVNNLSWAAEVFYRRLMSVVDDFGIYDGRASIIRGILFPLRLDKVSEADVLKWMDECSNAAVISFYQVENKPYLEIVNFNQTIRIKKHKYPVNPNKCKQMQADASGCMSGDGVGVISGVVSGDGVGDCPPSPTIPPYEGIGSNQANRTPAENFGDISPGEMLIPSSIKNCHKLYLESEYFAPTREQVAMRHFISEDLLGDWVGVFVVSLTSQGHLTKTLKDFAAHFSNWLPKQDLKKTPKQALDYEQQNSNTGNPGTKSGRASPQSFYNAVKSANNNR